MLPIAASCRLHAGLLAAGPEKHRLKRVYVLSFGHWPPLSSVALLVFRTTRITHLEPVIYPSTYRNEGVIYPAHRTLDRAARPDAPGKIQ